ncbi:hypothetical protein [Ochrobactrum teleogrylli]|uniref:Uncharacterized protein n=1 Tax=Ochrobactrum teleogrylli TaxID=2479765 RepID=A0ABD5K1U1_9HYPH|nr:MULTISPECIES: hypothetical protein [unclassified Ochrobactrum]MBA8845731.1 hypothetical protein [Ochrobactrum sp. RH1CCR137]MBA8857452.1 hypothetical protein [Ochrobactrum sp. RH1CCR134]
MQISYDTADLKQCCLNWDVAEQRFGRTYADQLITELADAEAFENVSQWHEFLGGNVTINGDDSFEILISTRYRATFVSVDRNAVKTSADRIDWTSVEFVKITSISEVP